MRRGRDSVRTVVDREKRGKSRIHSCICFLGGAMPVAGSMPDAKGRMAHSLRWASWEPGTPASFDATPLGTYPQGRRLFLSYFGLLLHFLKPYSRWCCTFVAPSIALYIWKNTVVFLPLALRQRTRTRFSFQGTIESIAHLTLKMQGEQGLKPFFVKYKSGGIYRYGKLVRQFHAKIASV